MLEFDELFKTAQKFFSEIVSKPEKLSQLQMDYWREASQFLQNIPHSEDNDKRFQHEIWQNNPFFQGIKQYYLFNAAQLKKIAISESKNTDKKSIRKMNFLIDQWLNAVAPSNFLWTNPEILKETLETGGENLKKGHENFLKDFNKDNTHFSISMTDHAAFEVGKNLAITKGEVIYKNEMIELIQYLPTTAKTYTVPLLIVPPWINKYYILDLQPHNSFVKWIVDQGYTVFMISWVNPDARYAEKDLSNYMQEGILDAIQATGHKEINALGFCIGGTLLACALAYLASKKNNMIKSATYLATLLDFSEPGDIEVFIDEPQISALEKAMQKTGYLDGKNMAAAFSLLRSNDLIWSYYVNHYLRGKSPVPFDILYWNADSTNMPYKMHSQYLRSMYLENKLIEPGGITLSNVPLDLSKIKVPTYCLAAQNDHIAPWKSVFNSMQYLRGPLRFVLGGSGHIAGIVNPPPAKKYGYRLNEEITSTADEWVSHAVRHEGSWWEDWSRWLSVHSGTQVKAISPKKSLAAAPGLYVKVR